MVRAMSTEVNVEQVVLEVTGLLRRRFPHKPPGEVEAVVREQVEALKEKPVSHYVSVLARRAAKKRLSDS